MNHPPCPSVFLSVHISCKHNSFLTDEPILMKLDTIVVNNQRRCMKEDNHCPNCFICYIFDVLVPGEVYKEAQ